MFDAEWDAGLDDAQLAAATHGDGALVVLAGAGTGKTRTLTARVACLLQRGVSAERVLLLTFTRRAADDMLSRAAAVSGQAESARRLWGGTFHAIAHRLVAAYGEALGLSSFSVLDPADVADVMSLLRVEHGLAGTEVRVPRAATLVDVYSRCVNTQRPLSEVVSTDFPWCQPHRDAMAALFKAYVARKRATRSLDFDDLLLSWRALLADRSVGARIASLFDHVLVDEYQDVNSLQVDIVRALKPDGQGLTVVGDDAQAVYGFRGADARHLHDLVDALPDVTVVRLERNFRSRQRLLDLANVVRPSAAGQQLTLHSDRGGGGRPVLVRCHDAPTEARAVVERVLAAVEAGGRLRDQAVLMRAAHHSDLLEIELTARRVPYVKYGGLRYLEAAHVKDFVATARLLDNPADEVAWFRLLRLHPGIGPATARRLLPMLAPGAATEPGAGEAAATDPADPYALAVAATPPSGRVALAATLPALDEARNRPGAGGRAEAIVGLLRPLLIARYPDSASRLGDLERLAAASTAAPDLAALLAELTLDPPQSTADLAGPPHLDEDYLVLSTVHSAKGLEWPVVHLIHLVDGAFPSDMALGCEAGLAEERRLFYVAVTRARDELLLYAPLRMPHHRRARDDRHSYAAVSRFVDQAAQRAVDIVDVGVPRPRVRSPDAVAAVALPALDELWR